MLTRMSAVMSILGRNLRRDVARIAGEGLEKKIAGEAVEKAAEVGRNWVVQNNRRVGGRVADVLLKMSNPLGIQGLMEETRLQTGRVLGPAEELYASLWRSAETAEKRIKMLSRGVRGKAGKGKSSFEIGGGLAGIEAMERHPAHRMLESGYDSLVERVASGSLLRLSDEEIGYWQSFYPFLMMADKGGVQLFANTLLRSAASKLDYIERAGKVVLEPGAKRVFQALDKRLALLDSLINEASRYFEPHLVESIAFPRMKTETRYFNKLMRVAAREELMVGPVKVQAPSSELFATYGDEPLSILDIVLGSFDNPELLGIRLARGVSKWAEVVKGLSRGTEHFAGQMEAAVARGKKGYAEAAAAFKEFLEEGKRLAGNLPKVNVYDPSVPKALKMMPEELRDVQHAVMRIGLDMRRTMLERSDEIVEDLGAVFRAAYGSPKELQKELGKKLAMYSEDPYRVVQDIARSAGPRILEELKTTNAALVPERGGSMLLQAFLDAEGAFTNPRKVAREVREAVTTVVKNALSDLAPLSRTSADKKLLAEVRRDIEANKLFYSGTGDKVKRLIESLGKVKKETLELYEERLKGPLKHLYDTMDLLSSAGEESLLSPTTIQEARVLANKAKEMAGMRGRKIPSPGTSILRAFQELRTGVESGGLERLVKSEGAKKSVQELVDAMISLEEAMAGRSRGIGASLARESSAVQGMTLMGGLGDVTIPDVVSMMKNVGLPALPFAAWRASRAVGLGGEENDRQYDWSGLTAGGTAGGIRPMAGV